MDCTVCESPMKEIERYSVDIEICPECKGVWLDRGEIEKIAAAEPPPHEDYWSHKKEGNRGKKKKGFREDLLDF
jgi:Zn-finger nucleic acid-binding protein